MFASLLCSADPAHLKSKNELPWRLGVPHPKSKQLLLRYATTEDVKERNAAKKSKYYRKYNILPATTPVQRRRRRERDWYRSERMEDEMEWDLQTEAMPPLGGEEDLRYCRPTFNCAVQYLCLSLSSCVSFGYLN